jgi:Leucine-rich repeat (LRR) protein
MINLTNLEDLKINKNQLRFIPSSILKLNRLMILSAQSNHLQNFSEKELS